MKEKLKRLPIILLNFSVVLFLFYLPFYLFEGRLFLGGDDTRFYYAYPSEVLTTFALFSWNNISSLPLSIPNFQLVPFLIVSIILENIIKSKVILFYFLFSLPLVVGFIYFQKLVRELIGKEYLISFTAALIFVLSPITVVSHISHFLTPVWLIALAPIISYYYIRYIRVGKIIDICKVVLWSVFLSFAYLAVPWILGLLLPFACGFLVYFIFIENPIKKILRRSIEFLFFILASQLFWFFPFIMSLTYLGEKDLGGQVVSKNLIDSFSPTVLAIATGNIINPLLTLYHRQIAFEYDWHLKKVFLDFFDPYLLIGTVFIFVIFLGIIRYKKVLKGDQERMFLFFFIVFICALYFFTVNIGFLVNIFLSFKVIPGFSILRNFIDKSSLGYIFAYALFLSFCLLVAKKTFKFYPLLISVVILVIAVNTIPIKQLVDSPIWTTKSIKQTVTIPEEYISFTKDVKSVVRNSSNVFSLPQNVASYSVIAEPNGRHVYLGTSPFKFFSGINDLTGHYPEAAEKSIQEAVMDRNYSRLLEIFENYNIGYLMVTNNIPKEIYGSYLIDSDYIKFQDQKLIDGIAQKKLLSSKNKNYELYELKVRPSILSSINSVTFEKVDSSKYKMSLSSANNKNLEFLETYHPGWKLYVESDSNEKSHVFNFSDISYLFKKPIFDDTHNALSPYGNVWKIDGIRKSTPVTLYFLPQSYFYVGIVLTITLLFIGFMYLAIVSKKRNNEKKK